ncbi:sigma E protease regulator RseP [Gynuella sunshinyii]|uniref:Zinc metalloprotease n=1 Tax=Gynuella sunshinyii YC6258 TaxID=1445510 RepID=A0A0C5V5G7_9GAMM|nr:sigma E protease regulator RseP [Gynuella sunshinyii]AJQ94680.1 putative membrane-associated Zn-dependent protease 1 [Gynuella sunshinyii YC6258]
MMMIIGLILTIGILVTVHEYGHFWVARRCGVRVLRFSVGFGKPLFKWYDRYGTEYVIAAIPLGGYVKMLDAREGEVDTADLGQEFTHKSLWQRIAIVSAGPIANFIFAIVAYWLLFMIGTSAIKSTVGEVVVDSPAAKAGMTEGITIRAVDGQDVENWQDISYRLVERIGETGTIEFTAADKRRYLVRIDHWLEDAKDPNPVESIGISPFPTRLDPVIDQVVTDSQAEKGGLKSGDRLLSVNGRKVDNWSDWVHLVQQSPGVSMQTEVQRGDVIVQLTLVPDAVSNADGKTSGFLGATVVVPSIPDDMIISHQDNPATALIKGFEKTWQTISLSLRMFGKMLTGEVSVKNISGPVSIAKMAGESVISGPEVFIGFLAFVSISLGVFNLLPIPVLDGGHLLFYLIEGIFRRPLPEKVQILGVQIGASLLLAVMVFAVINDFSRL